MAARSWPQLVHVRRAAPATRERAGLSHLLHEDVSHRCAAKQCVAVRPLVSTLYHAWQPPNPDGTGLLPIVQVAEALDEVFIVQKVGGNLHAPHAVHQFEEIQELRP